MILLFLSVKSGMSEDFSLILTSGFTIGLISHQRYQYNAKLSLFSYSVFFKFYYVQVLLSLEAKVTTFYAKTRGLYYLLGLPSQNKILSSLNV